MFGRWGVGSRRAGRSHRVERDALVQAEAGVARLRRDLPSAETARDQQAVRVAVSRVGTDARTVANIAELTAR